MSLGSIRPRSYRDDQDLAVKLAPRTDASNYRGKPYLTVDTRRDWEHLFGSQTGSLANHVLRDSTMYINNRIPRPGTSKSTKLTARELEVLSVIAQGNSSSEAADKLYLSKRTVDFHIERARGKLGVATRVQAVMKATSGQLINP